MRYSTASISAALLASTVVAMPTTSRPMQVIKRQEEPQCLLPTVIQQASSLTGQEPGTEGINEGQRESLTDNNNFINFCDGQTLTNGQQNVAGSCNSIPMGQIPSNETMISALILNPPHNAQIPANQAFDVTVQVQNLEAGAFTNPTTTYYAAPQELNGNGQVIGHCHITIQDLGSFDGTTPPNPARFAFFKGIDDAGNGQGLLTIAVEDVEDNTVGLQPGFYRVCTMISASNHQPVLMPVAQRGAQDDCIRFEVVDGNGEAPEGGDENNGSADQGAANGGDAIMGEVVDETGNPAPPEDAEVIEEDAGADAGADENAGEEENAGADENAEDAAEGNAGDDAAADQAGDIVDDANAEEGADDEEQNQGAEAEEQNEDAGAEAEAPQVDSGSLGGDAPAIEATGDAANPFNVAGQAAATAADAVSLSCRVQFNNCADAVQTGANIDGGINACVEQLDACGPA